MNGVIIASVAMALLFVFFFAAAMFSGNKHSVEDKDPIQLHIYINENDTVVHQLQLDVSHLSKLLEDLQSDTVAITRIHPVVTSPVER